MVVYEVTKNHNGWCETSLVKTVVEAKDACDEWFHNTPYSASWREINLVEWLLETLDAQVSQLDGDWLIDNLKQVLSK